MTLHKTVVVAKKFLLGVVIGIGIVLISGILFQLGVIIKNILIPPKVQPANHVYEKLPALIFPQNATSTQLTYKINTISGDLPEFPDRVNIYPIKQPTPSLLNLNKAKDKANSLGLIGDDGNTLPEKKLDETRYQWTENKGIQRKLVVDSLTFNFDLESNYLSSLTVLNAQGKLTQTDAVGATTDFMSTLALMPDDITLDKTTTPNQDVPYITNPQSFSIQNGSLVPTESFLSTQVYRVNVYQNDITYDLNTGVPGVTGGFKKIPMAMPILYPYPPYSTMSFWVAAGQLGPQVVAAKFIHQAVNLTPETEATYPIKTTQEAFEDLKNGKAYIASYNGTDTDVAITNVYLTYYLGETQQHYLMPLIVFMGDNGFFAYVSAVKDEWVK